MDHENIITEIEEGVSPNYLLENKLVVLDRPTMLMVNGGFWSRKDWDYPLPVGAECRFVELPRGGGSGGSNPLKIIAMIVVMVVSIYTGGLVGGLLGTMVEAGMMIAGSLLINMLFPDATNSSANNTYGIPNTIYSVNSGQNQMRIGQPYAEHFGRIICFPDLMQQNYTPIGPDGNQYLYFLGIIGMGEYEIDGVYIGDTPILDYAGTWYNIVTPGHIPELVTNVVWTSSAVSGQDLTTNFFTAAVSAPGTLVSYIEYDIIFGGGLISYNTAAQPVSTTVTIVAQARRIDDSGIALENWLPLDTFTVTAASKDPLRYSRKLPVPDGMGRYEFQIERTTVESQVSSTIDKVTVTGLRGYGGAYTPRQDITIIEAKILATDQLSGDISSRINVVCTRQLFTVGATGFSQTIQSTRSIIDAVAYMVTSPNGGGQPSSGLMFDVLNGLKTNMDTAGMFFDWRFTSKSSVMDACSKAGQCGRCVPYMPGGLFAMVQDDIQALPKMIFTDDDFDDGSLTITNAFRTADSSTCMRMTYLNPTTWQTEQICCYDAGGSELNPMDITLEGCSSRQIAYEIGMYLYRDDWLNRTTVEFTTGLKGHLPGLFNKIMIGATSTDWGQSGKIAAVETGKIWTSEPIDFKGKAQGEMYITSPTGAALGPFVVTPSQYAHCVMGEIDGLDTIENQDVLATAYLFGPDTIEPLFIRVMGIQPQGQNQIKIFGNIIDDQVYDDPGVAPALTTTISPSAPLIAISLVYTGLNGSNYGFNISWTGLSTNFRIEVDSGSGYVIVADNYAGYRYSLLTTGASINVKITPYEAGILTAADALTQAYAMVPVPQNLVISGTNSSSITFGWSAVSGATNYIASLFVNGSLIESQNSSVPNITLNFSDMAALGGPWPTFTVSVTAVVAGVQSNPTTLPVTMSLPVAPTGLSLMQVMQGGVMLTWNSVSGATGYVVYMDTNGSSTFIPATQGQLVISVPSTALVTNGVASCGVTHPYSHYFKVAAINSFYTNPSVLNFSSALLVSG